jgi:hypothetical protein
VGTLVGSLVGLGIPKEEAEEYHAHFVEGRTIVTVKADHRYPEAVQILEAHGGHVSFPYTVTDKTEKNDMESGVVTRGTRPAGIDPEVGAGGIGLGSRLVDEPSDMTHPFTAGMPRESVGSASASSSIPDAVGEDVDEPIGTGEPMRPEDTLHFDRESLAGRSGQTEQSHIGQRLESNEPVRASDQQTLAEPIESLPSEEPTSAAA